MGDEFGEESRGIAKIGNNPSGKIKTPPDNRSKEQKRTGSTWRRIALEPVRKLGFAYLAGSEA